jgi:hypothetical protein
MRRFPLIPRGIRATTNEQSQMSSDPEKVLVLAKEQRYVLAFGEHLKRWDLM